MKRLLPLLSAVLSLVLVAPALARAASPPGPDARQSLIEGNRAFAAGFYRQLGAKEGNLFFSPYSVSSALAMTYSGARGNTAAEMARALGFTLDQKRLHPAFGSLNRELAAAAGKSGQKLDIANGLVLTGGNVSRDFRNLLKKDYEAEIFHGGLKEINGWVKRKTAGKIDSILEELNANSVCVLLNAVYFKGSWEQRFDKGDTRDAPFHVSADRQVTVPLMYRKGEYRHLEEKEFQAISLPYKGNGLSMVVLLPHAIDGLPALERTISGPALQQILMRLDGEEASQVRLFLPRFKLETGYDLVEPFLKLGMKDAFSVGKADFTGMGWPKGDLWIGQIKHKAVVEVNEEGTEAAAATAVEMVTKGYRPEPVVRADHPFLFLIRDNRSGTILFMGRLANPGK